MSNAHGNDNRGVRRWLREMGYRPTVGMVERVQREVSRTQTQHENVARIHREISRETGAPTTVDMKGRDAKARAKRIVEREIAARPIPKVRGVRSEK